MLSCNNLTVKVPNSKKPILENANVSFKAQAMNAVIGPSGCGKTTLLKAMLKIIPSTGDSFFCNNKINSSEDLIGKVGFAPQFTCAQGKLSVRECIQTALDISVKGAKKKNARIDYILNLIGLKAHSEKLVESLSGGQLRRIGLGIELANDPSTMFCDEITTGLDPLSENAILDLLKELCEKQNKTFICIIHNLAKLDYFDLVTVIYEAQVVYQGSPENLNEYFGIDSTLKLYDKLNQHSLDFWLEKYSKISAQKEEYPAVSTDEKRPGILSQTSTLLARRTKLFFRDTTYLFLTLAITFGFPIVVVIFALGGLPQIESLSLDRSLGFIEEMQINLRIQISAANTSALVTGLILFQVVLLNLMAANNGAREIASERNLYEKERLIGLSPIAYASSKIIFTALIAGFQALWMCLFVKYVCAFPGSVILQMMILSAICISMTWVCLAFSACWASPEKANLVSIYLVGFQLPLSGVVLALPESLVWICRPFINTYWGWAGYLATMKDSRIYDAFIQTQLSVPWMPSPELAITVLGIQALVAVYVVFLGCFLKKWQ